MFGSCFPKFHSTEMLTEVFEMEIDVQLWSPWSIQYGNDYDSVVYGNCYNPVFYETCAFGICFGPLNQNSALWSLLLIAKQSDCNINS